MHTSAVILAPSLCFDAPGFRIAGGGGGGGHSPKVPACV